MSAKSQHSRRRLGVPEPSAASRFRVLPIASKSGDGHVRTYLHAGGGEGTAVEKAVERP